MPVLMSLKHFVEHLLPSEKSRQPFLSTPEHLREIEQLVLWAITGAAKRAAAMLAHAARLSTFCLTMLSPFL
jgi:hypothetical protein